MIRRARQLVTLVRNLWFLRREIVAHVRRRRRGPRAVEIRCLRCNRPLTKPCRPNTMAHVFRYPEGFGDPLLAGELFYVRQTKPGRPADVRREPF